MPLQKNHIAPDFSIPDQDGINHTLQDLLKEGPLVLFFYPKDDSPGCTRQACSFRDHYAELQASGVSVAGVSRDNASSHRAFRDKHRLPYPLLTDLDGSVHKAYGVGGLLGFLTRRITYLIGEDQTILHVHEDNLKMSSHIRSVLRQL